MYNFMFRLRELPTQISIAFGIYQHPIICFKTPLVSPTSCAYNAQELNILVC